MSVKSDSLALDYFLLVLLGAIFASSFTMTKLAVVDVPPATMAFVRIALAAAALGVVMVFVSQNFAMMKGYWGLIFLAGLFGNALPFTLVAWGQGKVDAGLTAILMAVMPLITIVMAHFFTLDERLNIFKVVGFILGLVGVAVLIGFEKLAAFGSEGLREAAIMGAACCYAIHALLSKSLTVLPRKAVSTAMLLVSALMLLPLSLYFDQPWTLEISGQSWLMLVLLGLLPTALGTLVLFAIIGRQGAGFLSQINFIVPLFGVLWAVILLDETLPPNALAALVIILAGVAIARIKPNPKLPNNPVEQVS